jgi:hypothetical protein
MGHPAVTGAAFQLLARLAESQPDGFAVYARQACDLAVEQLARGDLDTAGAALDLIVAVLANVSQEPSEALALIPPLLELLQAPAEIQEHALAALGSAVAACGDDAEAIPDALFPTAWEIARRERASETAIAAEAVSVVGAVLAYAPQKAGDAYPEAFEYLVECSRDANRGIKYSGIAAATAVVRNNPEGVIEGVPQLCFWSAVAALGEAGIDEDELAEKDASNLSTVDVAIAALDLIRKLFGAYPDACVGAFSDFGKFVQWGTIAFRDWIRHPGVEIAAHAARAAVPFFAIVAQGHGDFPLVEMVIEQIRKRDQSDVVAGFFVALRKLFARRPSEMAVHLQPVIAVSLDGLNRALPCQVRDIESDEERFGYDAQLQPKIHDTLVAAIEAYKESFPMQPIIECITAIAPNISAVEACALLGVLASYADLGGDLPPSLVDFALSKLDACDFSVPPDPIFFVRVILRDRPSLVAAHVPQLVQFFAGKLAEPVSLARYYWTTVTNIISAVLEIAFSSTFGGSVSLSDFLGPMLAHLPVRGDLNEAAFIYGSLVRIVDDNPDAIAPHAGELFRVLTETLAGTGKWFKATKLSADLQGDLVRLIQQLGQSGPVWETAAGILGGDSVRIARLHARLGIST